MCYFPDIAYPNEVMPLDRPFDNMPPGVQGQITILTRLGLLPNFEGIVNMNQLEGRINELIQGIPLNLLENELLEIFHLIQIWGGNTGRYIYIKGNGLSGTPERFNKNFNVEAYRKLVTVCINENSTDEMLYNAACEFNNATHQINVSFITKHVKFWNSRVRDLEAVPIYDNIMATNVMEKKYVSFMHLSAYWACMRQKAGELGVSVSALERTLFNHFR